MRKQPAEKVRDTEDSPIKRRQLRLAGAIAATSIVALVATGCSTVNHSQAPKPTETSSNSQAPSSAATHSAPKPSPSKSPPVPQPKPEYPHRLVTTTVFWTGEDADSSNGGIANAASTWDDHWALHYGGIDAPDKRRGYLPAGFTPKENSFYAAIPYSGYHGDDIRDPDAKKCLQVSGDKATGGPWCKNIWLAVTLEKKVGNKYVATGPTVYAQVEDAGPFGEDDTAYVFGTARPKNHEGDTAGPAHEHPGLDLSPAARDFLLPGNHDGENGTYVTDWHFVKTADVPNGPWKQKITATPGRPETN